MIPNNNLNAVSPGQKASASLNQMEKVSNQQPIQGTSGLVPPSSLHANKHHQTAASSITPTQATTPTIPHAQSLNVQSNYFNDKQAVMGQQYPPSATLSKNTALPVNATTSSPASERSSKIKTSAGQQQQQQPPTPPQPPPQEPSEPPEKFANLNMAYFQSTTPTSVTPLYDTCCFLIHCPVHSKVAILKPKNSQILWLPFIRLPKNTPFGEAAQLGLQSLLATGGDGKTSLRFMVPLQEPPQLMEIFRCQVPDSIQFTIRLTFYVKLNPGKVDQALCCQPGEQLQWVSLDHINSRPVLDHVWGPELNQNVRWTAKAYQQKIREYDLARAYHYLPRPVPRNVEEATLKTAGFSESDVERAYQDYLNHCFPSFFMPIYSFKNYMIKYGFETNEERLIKMFNSFNTFKNGYLSYHELLIGLALIEPNAVHGEQRSKFVFRFYDFTNRGYLTERNLRTMLKDMYPKEGDRELDIRLKEAMKAFKTTVVAGKRVVTYEEFYSAIGQHKFRGTSVLCRSKKIIMAAISCNIAQQNLNQKSGGKMKKERGQALFNRPGNSYEGRFRRDKSRL